jgi:hypothetical protein
MLAKNLTIGLYHSINKEALEELFPLELMYKEIYEASV